MRKSDLKVGDKVTVIYNPTYLSKEMYEFWGLYGKVLTVVNFYSGVQIIDANGYHIGISDIRHLSSLEKLMY